MHNVDKLTVGAISGTFLSFITTSMPYLQFLAVVVGIVASVASIMYHYKRYRAKD